jgi:T-complex protein 1 subunit alpha
MDRSLHDALSVVKRVLESGEVVPGGGATEAALSVHLERFALSMGSREQLAVAEFADSLLALPKALAVNAAKDATELVARLRAYHYKAQHEDSKSHLSNYGLDLINGQIKDNLSAGVLEPVISKKKMLELATEAAITILRIDDKIELQANEEQQ